MKTGVLHGEYELTLDEKNRLLIPADIRRRLNPTDGTSFFIKLGTNGVPWIYSSARWNEIASEGESGMDLGGDQLDHIHFHYAMTYEVEWDKQGRAVIPERILRKTGIGKEVMLVGSKDHLELWNRAAWEEHTDALLQMFASRRKAGQVQQSQGTV